MLRAMSLSNGKSRPLAGKSNGLTFHRDGDKMIRKRRRRNDEESHLPASRKPKPGVLLVGDFPARRALARELARRGFGVHAARDVDDARPMTATANFDVVVAAVKNRRNFSALKRLNLRLSEAALVLLADDAHDVEERAAFATFTPTATARRVAAAVERAAESVRLRLRNDALSRIAREASDGVPLAGSSEAMRRVLALVERFARQDGPVLIEGEPGTEKESVARALWMNSMRREGPFVVLRPGSMSRRRQFLSLFGQERGSFRGARRELRGKLELAEGGVVFVDDAASLGDDSQSALLGLLEHGELRRAGSTRARRLDVRVVAGTTREGRGRMLRGLADRLSVMRIALPALRDRREDIATLAGAMLRRWSAAPGETKRLGRDARRALEGCDWPGNTRELEIVIERAAALAPGPTVRAADLGTLRSARGDVPAPETLEEAQRRHVARAIESALGNKTRAAEALGITRRRLYHLLARFGARGPAARLKPDAPLDEK